MTDEIRIIAPGRNTCPACAAKHAPGEPHDARSLYYMYRFYQKNRRLPTAEDAAAHCAGNTEGMRNKAMEGEG